jgi:hypothetical protein
MRNQSEYDALIVGTDDVTDALDHAKAIINGAPRLDLLGG